MSSEFLNWRLSRRALLVALVPFAAACSERSTPAAPAAAPTNVDVAALLELAQDDTPDALAVAQAVPGFGGYFIDANGEPTVYLTDTTRRAEAAQALDGFLSSFGWTAADLKVRRVDYDYVQLSQWYAQAWPLALGASGAVFSDLDEGSNRLRFGGVDAAAVAGIAGAIAGLGIPGGAVAIDIAAPVMQTVTLRDRIRPTGGGLQINFFPVDASTASLLCTLGFNATDAGVKSFITNSHCSNVQGGTETPTDYYQALRRTGSLTTGYSHYPGTDSAAFIAVEVEDPNYFMFGDCPPGRRCRYSDASRAEYNADHEFIIGRIMRTTSVNPATDTITVDTVNAPFRVIAEQPVPVLGQTVNKVGRTTGWTQGPVIATCVNVNISASEITQLCQDRAGLHVAGGDSGSPVFGFNTDGTVNLAGILWGSSTNLTTGAVTMIFSRFANIERELGDLSVADPLPISKKKPKKVN